MSYDVFENSEQDAKPVELYKFIVGSVEYRYTSAQQDIISNTSIAGLETYTALPIDRTSPEQSKELQRTALMVSVPRDAAIAALFSEFLPSERIYLRVYRQHDGNPTEFIKLWQGRVKQVTWKESIAEMECHPTLMALKRQGLRKNFGPSCQHALYDAGCGVNKTSFQTSILVSVVASDVLTGSGEIAGAAAAHSKPAYAADWFVSGYAKRTNGEIRFIVAQSGETITVLTPFTNLAAGETITAYAGCKRDVDTCDGKFGNLDNFYGFHVNPKRNPFVTGLK